MLHIIACKQYMYIIETSQSTFRHIAYIIQHTAIIIDANNVGDNTRKCYETVINRCSQYFNISQKATAKRRQNTRQFLMSLNNDNLF